MGAAHGCNDMLWSGHTAQTVLGWLFITDVLWQIRVPGYPRIKKLIVVYLGGYVIAVLLCRMHYSIDVFCAMLMAFFLSTHVHLRFWIWVQANRIVCNDDPSEKGSET